MYLVFDIGGTKMRIASSKDLKTFDEPKIVATPSDFDEGIEVFKNTANELCKNKKIEAIAGGAPGPMDKNRTMLTGAPNLPEWNNKPLKEKLEQVLGAKVFLENDTALVGLGEAVAGAGKNYEIVAYITISTGVNGVRVINGKIDKNAMGFEIGKQIIDFSENKMLEDLISGEAFEKKYNKKPYDTHDEKIWDEAAKILAYGLNNTIAHWSPNIVVLGGSMMKTVGIPIEGVRSHLKEILKIFPEIPKIEKAVLEDFGGLHGSMEFLKQNI
ncbi:ROK family protein [Patescibacteria group bacterium]